MRLGVGVLARLPVGWGEGIGSALGWLAYRVGWRREVVEKQLARAFPEQDESWVRKTAQASFAHLGRELVAIAALMNSGLDGTRRCLVDIEGRDSFEAGFAEGRGAVIVTGHFGNWEFAGSAVATLGMPVDAVMQSLKNRRLNRYLRAARKRLGIELIDRASAWSRLTDSLNAGRVVAFVADQDARRRGVFVPFFGRPASTHRAPALLAIRARAPFFVGGATRLGPRRYRGWMKRLEPTAGLSVKEQVLELTEAWTDELERRIRLSPEQYFWHHKRWKTGPPGTVPVVPGTRVEI